MTERERAADALLQAELELQRATAARLRSEKGSRVRLAAAKVAHAHAFWRACRALGVRPEVRESQIPDYGLGRLAADVLQRLHQKATGTPPPSSAASK